ncbi:MAG: putative transcriptional regulator [Solidesulfovibrio magneticus str. Maddingley MBC34]|uniref:Putative transcriptional regulator n=1 Tax=Solidesulfovibrio magneticus str. Maddingley MBC34 TaxID=1206767 RepID=K6GMY1_9BACT|nr:MAG: putative transcriptional regulator [Solidesulfovibrio magneticus str. Maddingley MBC34]
MGLFIKRNMTQRDQDTGASGGFEGFFERAAKAAGIASQAELAALLGVHRSAVTQAKRKDAVPKAWVLTVSRRAGADPDWLEFGRRRGGSGRVAAGGEADLSEIFAAVPKVRARLSAGGGSFETGGEVERVYPFRQDWLRAKGQPSRMVLMDVVGNSMEPEIRHGDMVLIDQGQTAVVAHGVYAVGLEDTVLVKRVEKRPGQLVLLSDNRDYAPIVLTGEELDALRVIGRVLWVGREL